MKVTIKGFVHKQGKEFIFWPADMSNYDYLLIGPAEFEFEVPEDFNPIAAEVAVLNKKLDKLADDYQEKKTAIQSRINDLLCLEAPASN